MPFFLVWNREWRIPYRAVAALEIAKRFMNKGALIEEGAGDVYIRKG